MRIVIDLQACQTASRFRGIGRYSLALAQAMARNPRGHELWLALSELLPEAVDQIRDSFAGLIPRERIVSFSVPGPVAEITEECRRQARISELIREAFLADLKPDFIHISSMFEGWVDDATTSLDQLPFSIPTAVTFYDLIPLHHPGTYLQNPLLRQWYERKIAFLQKANLLLAISGYTRNEAIEVLGVQEEAVVNISSAADECFQRCAISLEREGRIRAQYKLTQPFVMYTGAFDSRKNIDSLIAAFSRLDQETVSSHQLLFVGQIDQRKRGHLNRHARECGLPEGKVICTGYVDDTDLVGLFNLCALFVLPSLHEGFGLPALEAMACGAAVIGSNLTSVPEVIGRQDALFDPTRVESITAKLDEALNDLDFNRSLRQHARQQAGKFSWDRSARIALEAMETVRQRQQFDSRGKNLAGDVWPEAGKRRRLAYVSPLPPARTGIADYSAELLPALAKFYELTLIDEDPEAVSADLRDLYPVRTVAWFEEHATGFERILYQFGNSPFHKHMFDLLARYPGTVVLHDFFLGSAIQWMDLTGYAPGLFREAIFASHGYAALAVASSRGPQIAIQEYPCNLQVLTAAAGVIVHSEHARSLAASWYGVSTVDEIIIIPQVRQMPTALLRAEARARLGLDEDVFLVCSFGQLAPVKLNHRLIEAWLGSTLCSNPQCRLVFVGQHADTAYSATLSTTIVSQDARQQIHITGFVSQELFNDYLLAADGAVQLRAGTRGETSRSVLDCLAHGLPLIINGHGAMAEWPDDILIKLADDFEIQELTDALDQLLADPVLRSRISQKAGAHVRENHAPNLVARTFFEAIEAFSATSRSTHYRALISALACEESPVLPTLVNLMSAAESIAHNQQDGLPHQLLVDISPLIKEDLRTGIERVVRAILLQLLLAPPSGFRVEPVYADNGQYRYARCFTQQVLGISEPFLTDLPIDFRRGDLFLGLGLAIEAIIANQEYLAVMRAQGVTFFFVVYDLLPTISPELFPEFMAKIFLQWLVTVAKLADGLVCISRAVADELAEWLAQHPPKRSHLPAIGHFHLGADIGKSLPSMGLPTDAEAVLAQVTTRPSLLMVGTIEPRKGHIQALAAFDQLWASGIDVNLVLVGKMGWMMEDLADSLANHPERSRRLFWLNGISDEYLERLYATSAALLAASHAEGFGLPLIEAAQHKLPILARDIPVFREVAGEFATYYDGDSAESLALAIQNWLDGFKAGSHQRSDEMPWLTWDESAAKLVEALWPLLWP